MIRQQHKIKKRPDPKAQKKKSIWSPFKKCLINIPKNLIRIFIVVVFVSFLWATYIIMNEQYTLDFTAQIGERDFEVRRRVHPFFKHLQRFYDPIDRFKKQSTYSKQMPFLVPQATRAETNTRNFYRYFLAMNTPLHITDGCAHWGAIQKWTDEYLSEKFKGHLIMPSNATSIYQDFRFNEEKKPQYEKFIFNSENAQFEGPSSFADFVRKKNNFKDNTHSLLQGEGGNVKAQTRVFLDNIMTPIHVDPELAQDYQSPDFMTAFLKLQKVGFTYWGDIIRHPQFNTQERLVCMVRGTESFRMVPLQFKQNIYAGIYEDLPTWETPLNFFEKDPAMIQKFKMMQVENVLEATLTPGQCLYIPQYYWVQSETQFIDDPRKGSPESLFLTFEFQSSSALVEQLVGAIDKGILDDA